VRARWGALVAVALLATACERGDGRIDPLTPLPGPGAATPAHQVATGLHADTGTLDLVSGATTVAVRTADLGPARVRASTPDGAGIAPALEVVGDSVNVHLVQTGQPGPAAVTVLLDPRVRWRVRMSGGAVDQTLDLTGARLAGVDLVAGATRIDLRLPRPDRAVPVTMAGGATEFTLHVPAGVATAVRVGGGAASTDVDGVRRTGLPGGTVLSTTTAADRYDLDATAGVSTLVLDRT
jgi:hypothetical protein